MEPTQGWAFKVDCSKGGYSVGSKLSLVDVLVMVFGVPLVFSHILGTLKVETLSVDRWLGAWLLGCPWIVFVSWAPDCCDVGSLVDACSACVLKCGFLPHLSLHATVTCMVGMLWISFSLLFDLFQIT